MSREEFRFESLDELRAFVSATLRNRQGLTPGAGALFERILYRDERPCGVHFCLAAPKSVRLVAVWVADKRTVRFYDSQGELFRQIELAGDSLSPPSLRRAA